MQDTSIWTAHTNEQVHVMRQLGAEIRGRRGRGIFYDKIFGPFPATRGLLLVLNLPVWRIVYTCTVLGMYIVLLSFVLSSARTHTRVTE